MALIARSVADNDSFFDLLYTTFLRDAELPVIMKAPHKKLPTIQANEKTLRSQGLLVHISDGVE
jgi:hypothetical protein